MGCGTSLGKTAPVPRNASRGRTIRYHNVVLDFEKLGVWTGEPLELPLPLARLVAAGRDGAAVLVQRGRDGVIVGGAALALPPAATD